MNRALEKLKKLRTKPQDIPDDWLEDYEERAAILEYDGGLNRPSAEKQAKAEILARLKKQQRGTDQ